VDVYNTNLWIVKAKKMSWSVYFKHQQYTTFIVPVLKKKLLDIHNSLANLIFSLFFSPSLSLKFCPSYYPYSSLLRYWKIIKFDSVRVVRASAFSYFMAKKTVFMFMHTAGSCASSVTELSIESIFLILHLGCFLPLLLVLCDLSFSHTMVI
jgi:hypothetical protein